MAEYKFCPNCSYRLRPELVGPPAPPAVTEIPLSQRILALGGYLAFASLLLLLALAGIRLFLEETEPGGVAEQETVVVSLRDRDALPLTRDSFRWVEGGRTFFGLYNPSDPDIEAPEEFWVDDGFLLLAHEVSNDQYYAFLLDRATKLGHTPPDLLPAGWDRSTGDPHLPKIYRRGEANLPVTSVRFYDAVEFCAWLWETLLRSDPGLMADLPTTGEYVRAGRGDSLGRNFPWGPSYDETQPVVWRRIAPLPVTDPKVGSYDGLFGLAGNVAEWVYDPQEEAVAGGSYRLSLDHPEVYVDYTRQLSTPFGRDGIEYRDETMPYVDVGFRVALRRAPEVPQFTPIQPGPVKVHPPAQSVLGPWKDENAEEPSAQRLEPPPLPEEAAAPREFEISRAEITNRQYLAFLLVALKESPQEVDLLTPEGFNRTNHLREAAYPGPYGRLKAIPWPGDENVPAQGVTLGQAQAYARWLSRRLGDPRRRCDLPTLAQYLRAGRGEADIPYPWGDDPLRRELICAGRADEEGRAVSLLGRLGATAPPVVGLAGNVLEYVQVSAERWALAGGCFALPAPYCTLDSLIDATWSHVDLPTSEGGETRLPILRYCGFRVVWQTW